MRESAPLPLPFFLKKTPSHAQVFSQALGICGKSDRFGPRPQGGPYGVDQGCPTALSGMMETQQLLIACGY